MRMRVCECAHTQPLPLLAMCLDKRTLCCWSVWGVYFPLPVFDSLFSQDTRHVGLAAMISENSPTSAEAGQLSQQLPSTITTTEEGEGAVDDCKLTSSKARLERRSCQDTGTGGASATGDASESGRLPCCEDRSLPRFRRRSALPPKPRPPSVASPQLVSKGPAGRFCVQPYTPSLRSATGMSVSPPMARTTLQTAAPGTSSSSSSSSSSPSTVPRTAGVLQDPTAPVPPPRKKRKSPGTLRSSLALTKPDPPATVATQLSLSRDPVRPPVASPRRKSVPVVGSAGRSVVAGEVCGGDGTTRAPTTVALPTTNIGVTTASGFTSDVQRGGIEQDQRKETTSGLPNDSVQSTMTCCQGSRDTSDNSVSKDTNTTTDKSLDTRPPLPPRQRKKARRGALSSPAPSPKPSRARTLPQLSQQSRVEEDVKPQGSVSASTNTETQNSKMEVNSSGDKDCVPDGENKISTAEEGDGESPQKDKDQPTTKLENKMTQSYLNGTPPSSTKRRNTVANRPTLPPKPALPPKSQALRRYSHQRPPVPRPRSGVPVIHREETKETATSARKASSQNSSPIHAFQRGLLPKSPRNLAKSSPSLLSAVNETSIGSYPATGTHEGGVVAGQRERTANSESPSHSHGRKVEPASPNRGISSIVNDRRATLPSPNHMTSHVTTPVSVPERRGSSSPGHVTTPNSTPERRGSLSHVTAPISIPERTGSSSHVTSHVTTPSSTPESRGSSSHVTSQVITPNGVTERRGSSESPSRVRVLPTPQPRAIHRHLLGKEDRTKSLLNISSLPSSPARHLPGAVPPKLPNKRRFSKCSSVSDMLEMGDGGVGGAKGPGFTREFVEELKRVTGDGVPGEISGDGEVGDKGERGDPEGAESRPLPESQQNSTKKREEEHERAKNTRLSFAKQSAASVGDFALLEAGPSDTSSCASSEGRSSVMSSEHQSLLERARHLSRNRKWCEQPEVCVCVSMCVCVS